MKNTKVLITNEVKLNILVHTFSLSLNKIFLKSNKTNKTRAQEELCWIPNICLFPYLVFFFWNIEKQFICVIAESELWTSIKGFSAQLLFKSNLKNRNELVKQMLPSFAYWVSLNNCLLLTDHPFLKLGLSQ